MGSMKEYRASVGSNILDTAFCLPILMMSVYAIEGDGLVGCSNGRTKDFSVKQTVITVVMYD